MSPPAPDVPVRGLDIAAYTVPTDQHESDGTLEWDSTTVVVVHVHAGGRTGLGYTYTDAAAVTLIRGMLAAVVTGRDARDIPAAYAAMVAAVRNVGRPGIAATAISAVDIALWDLHARLLDRSLADLLGVAHDAVPIYGSGGFTSYDNETLSRQLAGWVDAGIPRVKMKVGRNPAADEQRVEAARKAIGVDADLYVDANGAWSRKEALDWCWRLADHDVRWVEEPVTSDDLDGLRLLRDRGPGGIDIAAGEYGYDLPYFRRMLDAGAVDCLQADVTRCGGITGFTQVGPLCSAATIDLSAHCAPQVSAYAACAVLPLRHLEYFHDHERIERLLFDGVLEPEPPGVLRPRRDVAGHGLTVKTTDADRYRVG